MEIPNLNPSTPHNKRPYKNPKTKPTYLPDCELVKCPCIWIIKIIYTQNQSTNTPTIHIQFQEYHTTNTSFQRIDIANMCSNIPITETRTSNY